VRIKMNKLNESVLKYIETSDDQYASQEDFVMKDRKKIKSELKKRFKEHEKNRDDFIKINHNREGHTMQKTNGFKKLKLSESLFEDAAVATRDEVYYSSKRGSLVDILTLNLTDGEQVYLYRGEDESGKQKFIPTTRGGLGLDNNKDILVDIGGEDSRPTLSARVPDEVTANKVVELADRFDKLSKVRPCNSYSEMKFQVTIYLDDDDFEGDYVEDGVNIRPDNRGKKKVD
jgi:hypothetical protein